MKKVLKFIKDYSFGIILGIIIFGVLGVGAVNMFQASNIIVDASKMPNVGSNKTVQDTIEYLYSKVYCPSGYSCSKTHNTPQVGDYVKMTPTSTSYITDTSKTGYTSTQTINPSELNTWRVIRINEDGTLDLVSEYVSSVDIYFRGLIGYKNYVGYLNVLASQYANSKYTVRTRHMGYDGQTEYLTDTANTVELAAVPWTSSTSDNNNESKGGGDTLYQTDYDLVKNIGILMANKVGTPTVSGYWLASRYYYNGSNCNYNKRYIGFDGTLSSRYAYYYKINSNSFGIGSFSESLRPIVTLKSNISYVPVRGTSDNPFVLE